MEFVKSTLRILFFQAHHYLNGKITIFFFN